MNTWSEFLKEQAIDQDPRLKNAETDQHNLLIPLDNHQLVTVTGPDAGKFLQGQTTCDIRRLEQREHLLGAHCNNKGRMISSFLAAQTGLNDIGLRFRRELSDRALAALKKYIVFSQADIHTDARVALAILGDWSSVIDQTVEPCRTLVEEDTTYLAHSNRLLELWMPADQAITLWRRLAEKCVPAPAQRFDRHMIELGVAELGTATSEQYLPQMLNYDLLDGVSFKKGCYTGQEVVARMHYRGQVKKRCFRARIDDTEVPPAGTAIVAENDPEKSVGEVVASAPSPEGHEILVVTHIGNYLAPNLHIAQNSKARLQWLELPYAIPKE